MKILLCHKFFFPYGGAERYFFDLRDGLSKFGHTVIDFSRRDTRNMPSAYSEYFVKGVNLSRISAWRPVYNTKAALNFIYSYEAKNNLERLIDKFNPDIAHIHNIYHHISSSILHILRKRNIPVIMTLHDYKLICPNYYLFSRNKPCEKCRHKNYFNAIIHRCLKNSYAASSLACLEMYLCKMFKIYEKTVDLFIAPSNFVKNQVCDFGIDIRKIRYLPHAVNLGDFTPNFDSGKYVLYFGNISYQKGVMTLLKSTKYLEGIPVKIIGDGPQKLGFEHFARQNKLSNVEFLGYRPRNELINFIRDALFVVVPSEWYEVSGLNIYEAFACGKCVVGSNIGGIPELVEDGHTGLLFRPGDPADMAQKINYLIAHPEDAIRWGKNAHEKIFRLNNLSAHCRELSGIYDNLLNKANWK